MATVDSMLSTIFCAVPAFIRVDPASTSGPTTGTIATSATRVISESGTQVTGTVSDSADGVGRAPGGRDADDRVVAGEPAPVEIASPCGAIVFGRFNRTVTG